jgi:hypothetical protein
MEEAVSTCRQNDYGGAALPRQGNLYIRVNGLMKYRTFGGWCSLFEVHASQAVSSAQELQIAKRH